MQMYLKYFSNRYGNWHKDKTKEVTQKNVPRLIVYIMGGATYSEFRTGYEVTNDKKNWEVIIGKSVYHELSNKRAGPNKFNNINDA